MAKIHTVEWTPSILDHPTVIAGMRGNWWGILGKKLRRNFGRLLGNEDEVFSGIPGSKTEQYRAPYSLTEEFVSVYRMHPLMPDKFCFYSAEDGHCIRTRRLEDDHYIETRQLHEVLGNHVRKIRQDAPMIDLLYSFGIAHPGAITLGNYPKGLQELETQEGFTPEGKKQEGLRLDLAAVDILRDRERGVLRYNDFRKALGLRPVRFFRTRLGRLFVLIWALNKNSLLKSISYRHGSQDMLPEFCQ